MLRSKDDIDVGGCYLRQNIFRFRVINSNLGSHHEDPVFGDIVAGRTQTVPVESNTRVSNRLDKQGQEKHF